MVGSSHSRGYGRVAQFRLPAEQCCAIAKAAIASSVDKKARMLPGSGLNKRARSLVAARTELGNVQGKGHTLTGQQKPTASPTHPMQL